MILNLNPGPMKIIDISITQRMVPLSGTGTADCWHMHMSRMFSLMKNLSGRVCAGFHLSAECEVSGAVSRGRDRGKGEGEGLWQMEQVTDKFLKIGLSNFIAFAALVLSFVSIGQSCLARRDAAKVNKLDLRPELTVYARLYQDGTATPYIDITNKGPVDAVQVEIGLYVLRYSPERKKIMLGGTTGELQWTFERLPHLKATTLKVSELDLYSLFPALDSEEKGNQAVELRLTYRREVDLKQYTASAFYFMNEEGRFVSEGDPSVDSEIYEPIRKTVFTKQAVLTRRNFPLIENILHEAPAEP